MARLLRGVKSVPPGLPTAAFGRQVLTDPRCASQVADALSIPVASDDGPGQFGLATGAWVC